MIFSMFDMGVCLGVLGVSCRRFAANHAIGCTGINRAQLQTAERVARRQPSSATGRGLVECCDAPRCRAVERESEAGDHGARLATVEHGVNVFEAGHGCHFGLMVSDSEELL
jgi:hypothetical protein